MKKIFLSMLMLVAAGTAMAQMTPEEKAALKAAQKEAKSQISQGVKLRDAIELLQQANQTEFAKGDKKNQALIDKNIAEIKVKALEANELLTKALSSGYVADKQQFDANKALDDVSTRLLNPELELAAKHETFDTLAFAKAVDGVCKGCYGQLVYGNPKNELQKPVLAQAQAKMPKLMTYYAYLSMFYAETKNLDGSMAAFEKYANYGKNYPKVAEEEAVKNPQYPTSQMAFNLYLTAYNLKRYDVCEKYYDLAFQYPDEQSHSFVTSSRPQIYLQQGDTANWVKSLESMIDEAPNSSNAEIAIQNLLAHFSKNGAVAMGEFADKLLAKYPDNKMANYGKGHSLFTQEKYMEALEYFKKCLEADPEFVEGYNMCGMSLYRQANENFRLKIDGKKFKTTAEMHAAEEKLVMSLYRQATEYFEACRERAADKSDLWAGPLHTIYRNLKEQAKADELEPYIK